MDWLFTIDWQATFGFQTPPLEIVVRGSAVYLALFVLLRVVLKRQSGAVGLTDLLVIVLIADAAQNAMIGDSDSVPDGILLVAVIIGWSYGLDWLGYRVPRIQRLVHPPPLPLVRDGRLLRRNLRQELITEDELLAQLRLQGVSDLAEVKAAFMEGDGRISVVSHGERQTGAPERPLV